MASRCITDTYDNLVPEREFDTNVYVSLHRKQTVITNNYRVDEPDPNDGYGSADFYPEHGALEDAYRERTIVDEMNSLTKFLQEKLDEGLFETGDKFKDPHTIRCVKYFIDMFSGWEIEDLEVVED